MPRGDGPFRTMMHELRQFLWLVMALLSASVIWDLAQLAIQMIKGKL